jgi:hypothetical protein
LERNQKIPNPRKQRQKAPGEGAFPLDRAKQLWNGFDEAEQDITFEQFYRELCGLTDEKKMKRDLDEIQMREHQEQVNRRMIGRGLLHADN